MKWYRPSRLWPALAGVGLMFGLFALQAGTGTIQGVAKSGCVEDVGHLPKPYMLAEALNAKNGMVVATAAVNHDDNSFALGPLPEGQYRLCFQFSLSGLTPPHFYAYTRSFYDENDGGEPSPGELPHYFVRCFEEGTVINVADGVTGWVWANIGRNCGSEWVYTPPPIQGSVTDADGMGLEGIVVEILGACSANVIARAVTDANGTFVKYDFSTGSQDELYKLRLSDPVGHYRTSFYGATEDDFAAGTTVEWEATITAIMALTPPEIEVAPLVVDFGNVQLPRSATTSVWSAAACRRYGRRVNRGRSNHSASKLAHSKRFAPMPRIPGSAPASICVHLSSSVGKSVAVGRRICPPITPMNTDADFHEPSCRSPAFTRFGFG